jgi:hypothetical protein
MMSAPFGFKRASDGMFASILEVFTLSKQQKKLQERYYNLIYRRRRIRFKQLPLLFMGTSLGKDVGVV